MPIMIRQEIAAENTDTATTKTIDGIEIPVDQLNNGTVIPPEPKKENIIFGVSKDGLSRALVKFRCAPTPDPFKVSFEFQGTMLTHKNVFALVKSIIAPIGGGIKTIQWIDRNVLLGARNIDNRWVVKVDSLEAKELLIKSGMDIVFKKINIHNHDEIVSEEYTDWVEYVAYQKYLGIDLMKQFTPRFDDPEHTDIPKGSDEDDDEDSVFDTTDDLVSMVKPTMNTKKNKSPLLDSSRVESEDVVTLISEMKDKDLAEAAKEKSVEDEENIEDEKNAFYPEEGNG